MRLRFVVVAAALGLAACAASSSAVSPAPTTLLTQAFLSQHNLVLSPPTEQQAAQAVNQRVALTQAELGMLDPQGVASGAAPNESELEDVRFSSNGPSTPCWIFVWITTKPPQGFAGPGTIPLGVASAPPVTPPGATIVVFVNATTGRLAVAIGP